MRSRIFNVSQYEKNPKTGESLNFNEKNIIDCIAHKTIKEWAYIRHDKDVFTKKQIEDLKKRAEQNGEPMQTIKEGDPYPTHWHIVLKCDNAIEIDAVAKWLDIPTQYIDVPKGKGSFLDCVQYLTHESDKEQSKGKYLYSDDEIKANFDFRNELTKRAENKLKYGQDLDYTQQMLYDVMYGGKTIRQVIEEDPIFYMNNYKKIDSARLKHIQQCDPPAMRINYYIEGKGGAGKGLASRAIARSLYPDLENDDDIFFSIGGDGKTTFEGYDGQPVIIWNDCRSYELFDMLGSRGNIFKVFDMHPQKERQNIKYGSINLINTVNIVNSVQTYKEFLNGLAGEYNNYKAEDKGQSYRRFPIITLLRQDDISVLLNKGVFEDDIEHFTDFIEYMQVVGNFQKIVQACGNKFPIRRKIEAQMVKPITDKHKELLEKNHNDLSDEELLEMFKDYGKDTGCLMPF